MSRRPAVFALASALLMIVIGIPFLHMRLGSADAGTDPSNTTTRKAYDLLAKGFGPGYNGPLQLVAKIDNPAQLAAFKQADQAVAKTPGVVAAAPVNYIKGTGGRPSVAIAQVFPKGSPQDKSTADLLKKVRGSVIPAATKGSDVKVLVGGTTAIFEDFSHVLSRKLPLFIGIVVALSFLLLMAVFRSLVIPLTASLMNLLAAGAGFGVVVAVFQWGWGMELIGLSRTGPIQAFLPVMLFAILFGLSMDYEVFLISRVREEWIRHRDASRAVADGIAYTGRVISAAAAIMICVFLSFMVGDQRSLKEFGFGLAAAVFLDAIVVRCVMLPAVLEILGETTWKLPRWLDQRLPRIRIEGHAAEEDALDERLSADEAPFPDPTPHRG
jgi:putative drug exporter of the RND superfamily